MRAKDGSQSICERIVTSGMEHLTDQELVDGIVGCHVRMEISDIVALGITGLTGHGFTEKRAVALMSAVELGKRLASKSLNRRDPINSSRDVDYAFRPRLAMLDTERFYAIPTDVKNRPLAEICCSMGSSSVCPVVPSEIFRKVLRESAHAVIFVHNHPSGQSTPSADDIALTERLRRSGEILGIRVLDHIIIARDGYFSFLDAGLLAAKTEDLE